MKKESKNKKGFTLVELCVVIAVIAVVVAMISSFSVLMSNRTKQATVRNDVITDISNVELGIKKWILHYDNTDFRFAVSNGTHGNSTVLQAWSTKGTSSTDDDTLAGSLYIADNRKKLVCEGANDQVVDYINKIAFEITVSTTSGSGHSIISCDVVYRDASAGRNETQTTTTRLIFTTHSGARIAK